MDAARSAPGNARVRPSVHREPTPAWSSVAGKIEGRERDVAFRRLRRHRANFVWSAMDDVVRNRFEKPDAVQSRRIIERIANLECGPSVRALDHLARICVLADEHPGHAPIVV